MSRKVLTFGVFDYFHIGHLNLFENARALGDYLIVAVQDGNSILQYKPDANVLYSTEERLRLVRSLRVVDEVVIYKDVDSSIRVIDFDVFAVGGDQRHEGFCRAVDWCRKNGREIVRVPRTEGICSSSIKNELGGGYRCRLNDKARAHAGCVARYAGSISASAVWGWAA